MTYAITAADSVVPVTWTTASGTTATANMPTLLHASYASAEHTQAVTQIAEGVQQVTPAYTPTSGPSGGAIAGMGGATLIGLGILIVFIARWRHTSREVKGWFFGGLATALLIGSWGLFGTVGQTVRTTGDSVGNSVSSTVGQQTSAR